MKKLFFLGATMSMALCANAQSLDNPKVLPDYETLSVIPNEFSYNGTNRVVMVTGDNEEYQSQFTVYSNNFEELKTIQNAGQMTEYKYRSIEQKELLSAEFARENYVWAGQNNEVENDEEGARKAKNGGGEDDDNVILPYLTFEGEPTKAQVMTALQALGYTPEEDLYDYNGYSCYVIAREDSIVGGVKFSYPTQMVRIVSYSGGTYRARLYKLYYVDIYVRSETDYSCYPSYDDYGYMKSSFEGWTDDEIKTYLNSYLSSNSVYYDYDDDYVRMRSVITIAADPNNWKWFVCAQEKAGKFVLNRAGYVLHDGALYMSGYIGMPNCTYSEEGVEVFAAYRTENSYSDCQYINYDGDNFSKIRVFLTQKLFNEDAQYEYVTFNPIVKKFFDYTKNGYYSTFTIDGKDSVVELEGEVHLYYEKVLYNGLSVMSESGNVLVNVTFPSNFLALYPSFDIFILEGKKYLKITGVLDYDGSNNQQYATLLYLIGSNGSTSLAPVSDPIRVSVRPTYLGQDEAVTISTNENFKRNGQVRVVDMQGRVMQHKQIPAGQQSTEMHNLPQGVNFVQVMDGNQTIHTQPVIVK